MLDYLFSSGSADLASLNVPTWLDLSSVVVGSFSGILVGQQRKLDFVGITAISIIGGLGGGLVRDVIMQHGVYMLESRFAIPACLLAGLVGFLFPQVLTRHPHLLEWMDIFSEAHLVAGGTSKAIACELNGYAAVLMGIITGVGGGMLRDVFLGEVPKVFRAGTYYALCAVAGALTYYVCIRFLLLRQIWALLACVVVTVGLRRTSLRYDIRSSASVDLEPRLDDAYQSLRVRWSRSGAESEDEPGENRGSGACVRDEVSGKTGAETGDERTGGGEQDPHAEGGPEGPVS